MGYPPQGTIHPGLTTARVQNLDELGASNMPSDLDDVGTNIGDSSDNHDAATLFGAQRLSDEHVHSAQLVYPTLADGVTLTTAAGDWALGTITEIVPANVIAKEFDIHEIVAEDVNTQDKTYELVLYYGADDIEIGRSRFAASSNKGGVANLNMQTILIPANSRIRGQLAIQDGSGKTAKVSVRYHLYD